MTLCCGRRLLIATHNRGKKAEFARLFEGLGLELTMLSELGITAEVEENGATYDANALLKATTYARLTDLLTLADDSGLDVDALGGAPGVLSARYAGPSADDRQRYELLLRNLAGVPEAQRTARFRCVIALAWPDGRTSLVEGTCEGRIAEAPRGKHGFGYDPVFYLPEYGCTMAELPPEVKNRISHRARAAQAARPLLACQHD
ncbi:MAG: XTP/dITP diphosphatase [Chloroflexi bacterium]|jgi:XTP/dITP diphosphohydrolase|nr:XTP/dITP diphosphatase [Chloroflexota bacterium]